MTDEPRRRRLGSGPVTTEEFLGTKGEAPTTTQEPARARTLDDDLDPSNRPYRTNRPGDVADDPRLPGGWGRIVRTVYRIDEEQAFAQLSIVSFGARKPSRMEYGELVDALDECSEKIVLASMLKENASVILRLYELDVEALRAPMRSEARKELNDEKEAAKGKGKAITNDDVISLVVEKWPDEWRRQEENLARTKGAVEHAGVLLTRWTSRARELDGIIRTIRKV